MVTESFVPLAGPVGTASANFDIDRSRVADMSDLLARLHFSTADGRIWLDDQRMLLIHARSLGLLRREIIELVGFDVARGLLTRMGYQAGAYDARMARKVRSKTSLKTMFLVGPQMHCLEGVGLSEIVKLDFDVERGTHYGEFLWRTPVEDEEHIRHYSIGAEPACWMQTGYASGFSTEFMGRLVLYREVECQAMGHGACRIIGKTVEEWGEAAAEDLRFILPAEAPRELPEPTRPHRAALAPAPALSGQNPVGISPNFSTVSTMVRRVAPTQATVLFLGESGVGKEVFARMLHRLSSRAQKPFVALNCAAIPEHLVESELFGVERGAYTGATQNRLGRFERANGGTLFLDEIGTLTGMAQGKLLRVLQEGELERLGDNQTRRIDVRVVAATNVDLRDEVRKGRFREDLFFRLNVFPIVIPPLRERHEDIPLLMAHFLGQFNEKHSRRVTGFTQRALDAMLTYHWPGNIRELENVVERGVIMAQDDGPIDSPHLFTGGEQVGHNLYTVDRKGRLAPRDPGALTAEPAPEDAPEIDRLSEQVLDAMSKQGAGEARSLDEIETLLLKGAVSRANGNLAAAARLLGITRAQMVYRLKSRGLKADCE